LPLDGSGSGPSSSLTASRFTSGERSKVDLVVRDAVKRQLRDRAFAEAVRVTEGVAPPHRGPPRGGRIGALMQVRYLRSYANCVYCVE
jgi:hypothetical protein